MFYLISKVFWTLAAPLNLFFVLVAMCTGLMFTRFWRLSRTLLATILALTLVITITPLNGLALKTLEHRFPVAKALPRHLDGIVLLGADWSPGLTHQYGLAAISNQPGRLVAFAHLGLLYPDAKMIVATGEVRKNGYLNSDTVKVFLDSIGFPADRVEYEEKGRNTYETVQQVIERIKPQSVDDWALVTSAFHMPRSVGIARRGDWKVIPYPTDFTATVNGYNLIDRFRVLNTGLREWIGLAAYFWTGRSSALFPEPKA